MNKESIDLIYQYSKHYGNILYECESLYEEERGFILAITFFNIVENVIRSINEDFNCNFKKMINCLIPIISEKELNILHIFRDLRNKYTHKDLNQYFIEINGILYGLNEEETALELYKNYSNQVYDILVKLIENKCDISS